MSEKTLEDVLEVCCADYSVNFLDEEKAREFLVRQEKREQARHPEYDLDFKKKQSSSTHGIYFSIMVDKLLLFSYLTGKKEINHSTMRNYKIEVDPMVIEKESDLYALRLFEMGFSSERSKTKRTDETLFRLAGRIQSLHRRQITSQGWGKTISEILADEEVVKYFDKTLSYDNVTTSIAPDALRQLTSLILPKQI